MTIKQCRMARAALGWSLDDLAAQAKVARRSIARFEKGEPVTPDTVEKLRGALVGGGATFLDMSGRVGVLVRP
jgi:transcriptional regulator with XRE-family HTH domain